MDYLRLARPHLSFRLISPETLEHLEQLARMMPAVCASGFECRLGDTAPLADFGVRFLPGDGSRAVLAGREDAGFQFPEVLRAHPVYQRMRRFAQQWDTPGTLLNEEIEDIFFEFDVAGPLPEVPVPSFFLDFEKPARRRLETMEEALALLWGEPMSPTVLARVRACAEALPDGARVFAVGAMFSRRFDGVRLCFRGLRPEAIPDYLARVGWPGEPAVLAALIAQVSDRSERLALCIDVSASVLPRVGVECQMAEGMEAETERWTLLLERLVERGLCLPAKRDALLDWLGHTHSRAHPELFPEALLALGRTLDPEAVATFVRRISHIKLVHTPGQPPEAKAYLGFLQAWVVRDAAKKKFSFGDLGRLRKAVRR
ncbi:hypothetical protein D7W79_36670 [Corallococcus exercitus]|nr:hypothetical protein D7W79_36670 [Corallococcus exercitus]